MEEYAVAGIVACTIGTRLSCVLGIRNTRTRRRPTVGADGGGDVDQGREFFLWASGVAAFATVPRVLPLVLRL